MYDLEGSNNVDPLVSGFGSIYWTVKYICPVNLLSVLIFSKPTRACRGHPSSKHVCRPLALARPTPCILVQRPTQGVPIISGYEPCCVGERTRTSYPEGCLYGGLSVCLSFSIFLGLD